MKNIFLFASIILTTMTFAAKSFAADSQTETTENASPVSPKAQAIPKTPAATVDASSTKKEVPAQSGTESASPVIAPTSSLNSANHYSPTFSYYCEASKSYYPNVQQCTDGWIAVPVGLAAPIAPWGGYQYHDNATEETVKSKKNAVTLEMAGRALVYSVDYDRAISSHLTLGIGISSWQYGHWWKDNRSTVTVVPLYVNYYFTQRPSRAYLTLGADLISVTTAGSSSETFANNGLAATAGAGWELMNEAGFILRLGGVAIVGRDITINPSVMVGFAF